MVLLKATRRRSHLRAERPGLVLPADGLGGPGEVRGVHVLVLEQEGAVAEEDGLEAARLGVRTAAVFSVVERGRVTFCDGKEWTKQAAARA